MAQRTEIPVIDLFAGPGGLCEGFSSIVDGSGSPCLPVKVSIEKDAIAHRTLMLRALFRKFPKGKAPRSYYQYVRGEITREAFLALPDVKDKAEEAGKEARCAELGVTPHEIIDGWIREALAGCEDWILIGGPPCQAYSVAGRSRLRPKDPGAFENDKRHFLYIEYLRIIQEFSPTVFVMENVKGMLTSKNGGSKIFERILADLSNPREGLSYQVRSFVVHGDDLDPNDYVIEADDYGVPQSRHRVILFGIRSDVAAATPALAQNPEMFLLEKCERKVGVNAALSGLPPLRSRLSREQDSSEAWLSVMKSAPKSLKGWRAPLRTEIEAQMAKALKKADKLKTPGAAYIPWTSNQVVRCQASSVPGIWMNACAAYCSMRLASTCALTCIATCSPRASSRRRNTLPTSPTSRRSCYPTMGTSMMRKCPLRTASGCKSATLLHRRWWPTSRRMAITTFIPIRPNAVA